jgi:hypothetical protein
MFTPMVEELLNIEEIHNCKFNKIKKLKFRDIGVHI